MDQVIRQQQDQLAHVALAPGDVPGDVVEQHRVGDEACPVHLRQLRGAVGVVVAAEVEQPREVGVGGDEGLSVRADAGAEEVNDEGDSYEILSDPHDVVAVRTALQEGGFDYDSAEVQFVPSMKVEVDLDGANKVLKLIDALEEVDDIQNVFSNLDIPDEVAAQLNDEE